MKTPVTRILFTILLMLISIQGFAASNRSITGYWQTIDDVSNKPRSIVQIFQATDGTYAGKIIKVYYRPGEGINDVCDKCMDPAHKDKKILGMVILWGLKQTSTNKWGNGLILDPDNGKIYRASATMSPSGNQLSARGYIGISLFGRSQVWQRVDRQGREV